MIHVPAAVTTKIAARGRDAYRSTLDSHRLTRDLDSPAGGRRLSHGTRQSLLVLAELAG
jgi:hypothetical protein